MERKKNTKKATKAIRIKQDEKVTRIEPTSKDVSVKTEPKPKGRGLGLLWQFLYNDAYKAVKRIRVARRLNRFVVLTLVAKAMVSHV